MTVRWPVVDDVCARQSIRSTCFQIRGAANVRHAFEVRLSSQRSSRDRRAKMAATNSLGRSRRGDDMAGYMHKSWCREFARDRDASFATGLRYLASVPKATWCRCVDDVARFEAAASNGQQQPCQGTREAAITGGGCAVLYASSTFHKHACMQANNTYRNQPKSRIVYSVTHVTTRCQMYNLIR